MPSRFWQSTETQRSEIVAVGEESINLTTKQVAALTGKSRFTLYQVFLRLVARTQDTNETSARGAMWDDGKILYVLRDSGATIEVDKNARLIVTSPDGQTGAEISAENLAELLRVFSGTSRKHRKK